MGWGREAEAEMIIRHSLVPVWHKFGAQKLPLPLAYWRGNRERVTSPLGACEDSFPYPPVMLLETPMTHSVLSTGGPAMNHRKLCLHEAGILIDDELTFPILEIGTPVSVTYLMGLF